MSVKLLLATGIALAILLAYTLAMGKGGLLDMWNMKRDISAQQEQNERLKPVSYTHLTLPTICFKCWSRGGAGGF